MGGSDGTARKGKGMAGFPGECGKIGWGQVLKMLGRTPKVLGSHEGYGGVQSHGPRLWVGERKQWREVNALSFLPPQATYEDEPVVPVVG